jgi:hypothetical protein
MPRKDPVTKELREAVFRRDLTWIWDQLAAAGMSTMTIRAIMLDSPGCVAPYLDLSQSGRCSGRETLDHVKDQPMMGKRAPSDLAHLVTLCEQHHLWTRWATSNRPLLRQYLKEVNT